MGRWENVLKKLTLVYIQKGLPLGYTTQVLNFFNSHSFSNVGLIHYFFLLRILRACLLCEFKLTFSPTHISKKLQKSHFKLLYQTLPKYFNTHTLGEMGGGPKEIESF